MEKALRDKKVILSFLLPAVLVFTFTVIFPVIWSGYYSFFYWDGVTQMKLIGLANFARLFKDIYFTTAFINNLIYVLINLVGQVFVGLLVALLLTHITKGREFFKTTYFAPTILSSIAVVQAFQKFYSFDPPGIFNSILKFVGLGYLQTPWLGTMETSLFSVALIECYKNMGLYLIIIYSGLMAVPSDIIESAKIDGARGLKMFFYVKMPYIKNVLIVALIMAVNGLLKAFDIPFIATNGGPGSSSELVTTYMYKTAFASTQYGYGSAIAVFIAIECIVVVMILQKFFGNAEHEE